MKVSESPPFPDVTSTSQARLPVIDFNLGDPRQPAGGVTRPGSAVPVVAVDSAWSLAMTDLRTAGPPWLWSSGMTSWGRDPDLWPVLVALCMPGTVAWCLGCATGEEAYLLAARTGAAVVATDRRVDAIAAATAGRYRAPMVAFDVAEGRLSAAERSALFFDAGADWLEVRGVVRTRVQFEEHDALVDEPIVADVVLARNVLHMLDAVDRSEFVRRLASLRRPVAVGRSDRLGPLLEVWRLHFVDDAAHELLLRPRST